MFYRRFIFFANRPTCYRTADHRQIKSIPVLGLESMCGTNNSGGSRRAGGTGPPIFWQSQFKLFTLYTMSEKIFMKLNLDCIVAEIRGVFGSVEGVCVCVCVNRNRGRYCFLFRLGPILNDIRGHSDPKIYARL